MALRDPEREQEMEEVCEAGPSRLSQPRHSPRSAVVSPPLQIPGSYFPSMVSASGDSSGRTFYIRQSPAVTPVDRPKVTPLEMPLGTPDDPAFSNYPSTAPSRAASIKGKERAAMTHLGQALELHLGKPVPRRKMKHRVEASRFGEDNQSSGSSSPVTPDPRKQAKGRRRAHTVSHGLPPPESPVEVSAEHQPPLEQPTRPLPARHPSTTRRRASVGSPPFGSELHASSASEDVPGWPSMPQQERMRMTEPPRSPPFAYPRLGSTDFSMQTVSAVASTRPLESPSIGPRRSSLSTASLAMSSPAKPSYPLLEPSPTAALGLANILDADGNVVLVLPEDSSIPHVPPPRRSSLSFGPDTVIDPVPVTYAVGGGAASPGEHGGTSVLSTSVTTTEGSGSVELFSPSTSAPHPLSSATTSLSRSAKSSKEGDDVTAAKDAALTALKLQRSLEWEAKQTRHRRKLEKRRMILLELVETEVAYAEDLKALVEVYLPQLHALPSVPERYAVAVGRNAAELLTIHSELSLRMVEVLKEEGLGYEMVPEEDMVTKVERVSRRLAAALVDQVSKGRLQRSFLQLTIRRHGSQPTTSSVQGVSPLLHLSATSHFAPTMPHLSVVARSSVPRMLQSSSRISYPTRYLSRTASTRTAYISETISSCLSSGSVGTPCSSPLFSGRQTHPRRPLSGHTTAARTSMMWGWMSRGPWGLCGV